MEIKGIYEHLDVPLWFQIHPWSYIEKIVNGCGPGGWLEAMVPDNPMGIDFYPACVIHDGDYHYAKNEAEVDEANKRFRNNLLVIVRQTFPEPQDWWRQWAGERLANLYADLVDEGGYFFWERAQKDKATAPGESGNEGRIL
jgi:hypothetical protein